MKIFVGKQELTNNGSGGGTEDFNSLYNKPKINGIELNNDKSSDDLNLLNKQHDTDSTAHKDIRTNISTINTNLENHTNNTNIHITIEDRNAINNIKHNKGSFNSISDLKAKYPIATPGDYCICFNGSNYTMWTYSTEWIDTGLIGTVTSVNNLTGDIILTSDNITLPDGTSITEKFNSKVEPNELASVAFSGSYKDLIDVPTINNTGTEGTTDYNKLKNLPTINGITIKDNITAEDLKLATKDETMYKENYVSDINDGYVKAADKAKTLEGTELAKPYQFWGIDINGEAKYQYLPLTNNQEIHQGNFEQRELINVAANDIYEIGSLNELDECKIFVQAYTEIKGQQNIVGTIKKFNNEDKDKFYYNTNGNIEFGENGCSIKEIYEYEIKKNSDGFYETKIINPKEYIKIVSLKRGAL